MKKFILTVFLCGLAYGCYYYMKHKNKFIYEIPEGEVSSVSPKGKYDSLLLEYSKLETDLNLLVESSKTADNEVVKLRQRVAELTEENNRLRGTQVEKEIAKSTTKKTAQNDIPKKKELPIARNSDTRMLDEFFKNRYGSK